MRRSFIFSLAASLCGATVGVSGASASEPMPARAERIFSPGKSAASDDTADALVQNPANLAYLPAYELRYGGVRCTGTQKIACGHALAAATPVIAGLSTGVRADYVSPPASAGALYGGIEYTWLTWGLAYSPSALLSVGASVQRAFSLHPLVDGLLTASAGVSLRPDPHIAFSVVARDFTRPTLAPLPGGDAALDRSYVFAAAFRPTGRRAFEIGLDLKYLDGTSSSGSGQFIPRASVGVDVPGFGRARGDVEIAHLPNDTRRGVVGTVGVELALGRVTVGGGALFGSGLGAPSADGEAGAYIGASFAGFAVPGMPPPRHAVSLRIESTPGARGHVALLQKLWKLSLDPQIAGVRLDLRAEPAGSWAHAEELADALRVLRARGKKTLCSLENNGGRSLYVCANADRTVVNPAGGIRYSGIQSTYFYLAGALEKLGVKADFVRIGAHKSAPEQFTNTQAGEVARADHEDLLRQVEAVFVRNASVGRRMSEARVREVSKTGPFIAQEAKDAGFIDGFAFDDELDRATRELVGADTPVERYVPDLGAPSAFGTRDRVALIYVDGDMVDGRSQVVPLVGMRLVGSYTMADTFRAAREDASIKSVVVRIESPGGSSMAADVMWRELSLLAAKKPVIVSMGSVAASGGYYIAAAAREIYALPLTVTGSIGIFYGKADISGLLGRLGITTETYKTTPRADAESLFRGFSADERLALEQKIAQFYDVFLHRVSKGRHLTTEQVDAVGQGRVWTGQQALDHKLVDKMGGIREALDRARTLGGLPADAPIDELPVIEESLIERVLGLAGATSTQVSPALALTLANAVRAVAPLAIYGNGMSMARLESSSLEDDGD